MHLPLLSSVELHSVTCAEMESAHGVPIVPSGT